jgi:hypothetical protein
MNYINQDNDLILVSILNGMYNDNVTQINNMNASINNLTAANAQIRHLLVQTLRNSNRRTGINPTTRPSRGHDNHYVNNTYGRAAQSYGAAGRGRRSPYTPENARRHQAYTPRDDQPNTIFSTTFSAFFDPVAVYPTQTQIDIATRRVRYRDVVTPRNIACPISMVDFTDNDIVTVIRHCGHIFATDQLNIWFATHCTCPVCRFDIRLAPITNTSTVNDASGNSAALPSIPPITPIVSENARASPLNAAAATPPAVPTIYDSLLNNFQSVEAVASMFTDPSGNYMYSDSDPIALFNLISRINDTYSRN